MATLALALPAAADVIYSNLQEISIPNTYAGVYLDVNGSNGWNTDMFNPIAGWDINPFSGGSVVANSPAFQPVRGGTTSMSPILNLATGSSVGSSSVFSTFTWDNDGNPATPAVPGYGGSQTHLGTGIGQFTAGQEGYIGFQLNGTNYGWMRVVLGGATPVIKDWAYDTSGAFIATGNILQDGSTVTLDSAVGSFTLGSQITGANSVVKNGANTVTLTGTNTYSGTTTVNTGKLVVTGTIGNSAVTVSGSGTTLASGTTGTVGNSVTLNSGTFLAAGDAGAAGTATITGTTTFHDGSIFSWDIDSTGTGYDKLVSASLVDGDAVGGAVLRIVASDALVAQNFWNTTKTWNDIFTTDGSTAIANWANIFTSVSVVNNSFNPVTPVGGSFSLAGNSLTWTAVPEPTGMLAGLLLGAGVFLRSRKLVRTSGR